MPAPQEPIASEPRADAALTVSNGSFEHIAASEFLAALDREIAAYRARHWSMIHAALLAMGGVVAVFAGGAVPNRIVQAAAAAAILAIAGCAFCAGQGLYERAKHLRESRSQLLRHCKLPTRPDGRSWFWSDTHAWSPVGAFQAALVVIAVLAVLLVALRQPTPAETALPEHEAARLEVTIKVEDGIQADVTSPEREDASVPPPPARAEDAPVRPAQTP